MGNESSTPKPVTHEQIVSIINASNVKEKVHSEKTAKSVELIAYILLTVICVATLFLVYRLIVKYERIKNQRVVDRAISLNNVTTSTAPAH
ncbi:hypothetical protein RP20_CCG015430 [Aedes albopictus]|nr:hypothetical protein RP20_CCG001743 [Aedes albopictus]KXJ73607.1 hypothetical protein RP20_CCG015430 [Aedes albopictus]